MQSPNDFEAYWQAHRKSLLEADDEYKNALQGYKLTSGADWLLFALPVVVAIVVLDFSPFQGEFLNWAAGALAAIVTFVACVAIKTATSGTRSLSDIEADVKRRAQQDFASRPQSRDVGDRRKASRR